MKKGLTPLALLYMTYVLSSCGGGSQTGQNTETTGSGAVKIDGSSTVYPITEAIAEEFRTEAPEVRVTVGISGTGGGFKKFARGETDISNASRPMKQQEAEACQKRGIGFLELMVAYDGLAVLIHPVNDWVDYLTVAELKKLWEPAAEGVVTRWADIRKGWPNEPVNLYGPDVASGTYDYFTEAIVGESGASRGDYTNSTDDNVLVQGIAADKYALGFFGLAYYEENKDKMKLVGVDNGAGPVMPTTETVASNQYSPLSRPIYIYISDKAATRAEVVRFVEFYLENLTDILSDVGYIPLPEDAYKAAKAKFKAFVGAGKQ